MTADAMTAAGGNPDLCTYLEIYGTAQGFAQMNGNVAYKFFLGGDNTSDFSVEPGHALAVTFTPTEAGITRQGDWWKVEKNLTAAVPDVYTLKIDPQSKTISSASGSGLVAVTCTKNGSAYTGWTVSGDDSKMTASKSGSSVRWSVSGLNGGGSSSFTVSVGDLEETFTVTRDDVYTLSIDPESETIDASSGSGTVVVTCTKNGSAYTGWTVSGDDSKMTASKSGSSVRWSVSGLAEGGSSSFTVSVGGLEETFTVERIEDVYTLSIDPESETIDAASGSGTVAVTCTKNGSAYTGWTVSGDDSKMTASKSGSSVRWSVSGLNGGGSSSFTVSVGGLEETFIVTRDDVYEAENVVLSLDGLSRVRDMNWTGNLSVTATIKKNGVSLGDQSIPFSSNYITSTEAMGNDPSTSWHSYAYPNNGNINVSFLQGVSGVYDQCVDVEFRVSVLVV